MPVIGFWAFETRAGILCINMSAFALEDSVFRAVSATNCVLDS